MSKIIIKNIRAPRFSRSRLHEEEIGVLDKNNFSITEESRRNNALFSVLYQILSNIFIPLFGDSKKLAVASSITIVLLRSVVPNSTPTRSTDHFL